MRGGGGHRRDKSASGYSVNPWSLKNIGYYCCPRALTITLRQSLFSTSFNGVCAIVQVTPVSLLNPIEAFTRAVIANYERGAAIRHR